MILHLISSEGLYGAENMLLNLMAALRAKGHACSLGVFLNTHKPHLEVAECAAERGFDTAIIPCGGKVDWKVFHKIQKVADSSGANIIHTHGYKSDLYGFAANRGRLPILATCHNWTGEGRTVQAYETVDRLALRLFDRTVAVSGTVACRLKAWGTPAHKIVTIPNGVDIFAFRPPGVNPGGSFTVGFAGRLTAGKGVLQLLTAAREVLRTHPAVRFRFVGDGPLLSEMRDLALSLGIQGRTEFPGRQENMAAVYASFDMLVLPSFNEGLPMCLLEAMASGLPVVATEVGDVPKIVRDGITGLLISPADIGALAAAIRRVIEDDRLRQDMALNGRRLVETEYSLEQMADRYLGIYSELA